MPARPPAGYFITWSIRGSWLHGDERGSVDLQHNAFGEAPLPVSPGRVEREQGQANYAPLRLNAHARRVVQQAIEDHCRHRGWELCALHVGATHVHVVVSADRDPESILQQLKSWATRRLRGAGLLEPQRQPWTRHGSTRYLWDRRDMAGAVEYVTDMQHGEQVAERDEWRRYVAGKMSEPPPSA